MNRFVVDNKSSGGVIGGDFVRLNGGDFKFRVSFIQASSGKESEPSAEVKVSVHADPHPKVHVDAS
jgi:hypothetical protein